MNMRDAQSNPTIRLTDYQAPAWRIESVDLSFDLDVARTVVDARLTLRGSAAPGTPLVLNGEHMQLLSIRLDERELGPKEYHVDADRLTVKGVRDGSVLETQVAIEPAKNTTLEGLYLSGNAESGFLLTQCEAEGFRRITYFQDRPDVLASYTVTLRADAQRFPVLLAGGNPDGEGTLDDGRHWARFVDPHPKPAYLFALVAGHLEKISQDYTTAEGRAVTLNLWAEADAIGQCDYAMDALVRSMKWDEATYGRNYDLDVFHVVATHDFNMGAMENKGLNIFNAKYLLADPQTSTDEEYRGVEAVVAHEYFHNWSGNRVTCRDWFQLSLKEGLTVFREQSFSADMNSQAIKRIEDVGTLRRRQFPEDAGPFAHPVRPAAYREINNFYTATVYEKGAELVRMLAGRLGEAGFRKGTDLYFERNDGKAATIEDFLAALGDANGLDLSKYLAWYGQAGTPRLQAEGRYDAQARQYTLTLRQHTPATPGQSDKQPVPMPVKTALFAADGRMLDLRMPGEAEAGAPERVLEVDGAAQTFVFEDIDTAPIPSLLRGFSAPAILECDYAPEQLAVLLRHDIDGYNRWEADQQLASRAFDGLHDGNDDSALASWTETLGALFDDTDLDPALLAELLTPPGETELSERVDAYDPQAVHDARRRMQQALADTMGAKALKARYDMLHAQRGVDLSGPAQARRRLKRRVLELLCLADAEVACTLAKDQYAQASDMSDRLAALRCLLRLGGTAGDEAAADFRQRFDGQPLAMDKWFASQAAVPGEDALARVQGLMGDAAFTLRNPNRVNSLLGSFARMNPTGFHRADGEGYRFLTAQLAELDALNPQVAARLATAFNGWRQLEPGRREHAHQALAELSAKGGHSPNLGEIIDRALQG